MNGWNYDLAVNQPELICPRQPLVFKIRWNEPRQIWRWSCFFGRANIERDLPAPANLKKDGQIEFEFHSYELFCASPLFASGKAVFDELKKLNRIQK